MGKVIEAKSWQKSAGKANEHHLCSWYHSEKRGSVASRWKKGDLNSWGRTKKRRLSLQRVREGEGFFSPAL